MTTPWPMSCAQYAPVLARLAFSLAALVLITGCSTIRGTPTRYQPSAEIVKSINLVPNDLSDLQAASSESERNLLQNKAIAIIDLQFHQFVRELVADRSDSSAALAGTTLAASTAGAFVDSVKAKTNYALFAAGVVGAFGIVDKSYFYEKTVPALVAAMGAARATVLVRLKNSQRALIENYDGTAALADLEDYFSAGTVLAAIAEITARADSDKQLALNEVRTLDIPTDDDIARTRVISRAIFAINDQTLDSAKKALAELGRPEEKSLKAVKLALGRALRARPPESTSLVEKTLKKFNLLQ